MPTFPEPTDPFTSPTEVLLGYLDFFRERGAEKVERLPDGEATRSRLPSGWSPLELLVHLTHVERRWLEWGFLGADVGDPWGDERDGRWRVPSGLGVGEVIAALRARGVRTREIALAHPLDALGAPGAPVARGRPGHAGAGAAAPGPGVGTPPRPARRRRRAGRRRDRRVRSPARSDHRQTVAEPAAARTRSDRACPPVPGTR